MHTSSDEFSCSRARASERVVGRRRRAPGNKEEGRTQRRRGRQPHPTAQSHRAGSHDSQTNRAGRNDPPTQPRSRSASCLFALRGFRTYYGHRSDTARSISFRRIRSPRFPNLPLQKARAVVTVPDSEPRDSPNLR